MEAQANALQRAVNPLTRHQQTPRARILLAEIPTMSYNQLQQQRDVNVVMALYKYRYLTTSQVQQLYFPSEQTARRSLRRLSDREKLVKNFFVANISERIHHISLRGASFVAEQLGTTTEELVWSKNSRAPKDYYFMRHFIAINQFRIDLTLAREVFPDIVLAGFIPEYFGQKHASGRITKHIKDFVFDVSAAEEKINHTPDAVFALRRSVKTALFFLEIDRGTEVLSNPEIGFLKMLRFYMNYAKSGKYRSYEQEFKSGTIKNFRLLIVTTGIKRLEGMRQAASQSYHSEKALRFFWATEFDKVSKASMWQPIWKSLDVNDGSTYAIG